MSIPSTNLGRGCEASQLLPKRCRQFLQYMVRSATAMVVLGFLRPAESGEPSLEHLCSAPPLNSRCKDYLPGVKAKNEDEQPIEVDQRAT